MNSLIRELLKVSRELLSYHLGDEGWLLPDRTYLEVQMFQGHTQIVIDWYMWKHLRLKGSAANETFLLVSEDAKEWKKAGLPMSDFHYFSPSGYDPNGYAFDVGWIRINEGGFEIPNAQSFSVVQDFLRSKVGYSAGMKKEIYVNVYRGQSYTATVEDILEAHFIGNLIRF